jgi:DNA-binding beta-propeller fold protein YncE
VSGLSFRHRLNALAQYADHPVDLRGGDHQRRAANAQDGTISVLGLATRKVVQTLPANVMGANRLKFTPNGKLALVSSLRSADLAVFDVATRRELKRVKIGKGAAGIQMGRMGRGRSWLAHRTAMWW